MTFINENQAYRNAKENYEDNIGGVFEDIDEEERYKLIQEMVYNMELQVENRADDILEERRGY